MASRWRSTGTLVVSSAALIAGSFLVVLEAGDTSFGPTPAEFRSDGSPCLNVTGWVTTEDGDSFGANTGVMKADVGPAWSAREPISGIAFDHGDGPRFRAD